MIAQTIRASLLARATAATLNGLRALIALSQSPTAPLCRCATFNNDVAPRTKSRRSARLPFLVIGPSLVLPPVVSWRGVSPSQAEKSRPDLNACGSETLAATCVATLYHYLLAREAPYPWWDLPVVLGTLGGIGLLIGPIGLLVARTSRDPVLADQARTGMDVAFTLMLFLTSLTGLALLVLRDSAAMGPLLALHLGVVFALFITLPYGKFVHGLYRFVALVRYARERQEMATGTGSE